MSKGYKVNVDKSRAMVKLKVWGIWNEDDAKAYAKYFEESIKPIAGTKFNVIADISEFPPQRPEVNGWIQETMRHANASGMVRAANLVSSAMTKLQIVRLSQESGIPEFSFFQSEEAAEKWLASSGA